MRWLRGAQRRDPNPARIGWRDWRGRGGVIPAWTGRRLCYAGRRCPPPPPSAKVNDETPTDSPRLARTDPSPGNGHVTDIRRRGNQRSPDSSRRQKGPARHRRAWRHAQGRLLLAAGEDEPRGDLVPRGGERLHRGGDEADRGAAAVA